MSWLNGVSFKPIGKWIAALRDRRVSPEQKRGELVAPQIERALNWIWVIFFLGLIVIGLLSLGRPQSGRLHFFATAALAGICALGFGGAFGLLFGLPTSSGRTMVVTARPSGETTGGATTPATGSQATADDGWYRDNTSLEQIAQWLTAAIVALSLANFDGWVKRFDHLAEAVTCAMYTPTDITPEPAENQTRGPTPTRASAPPTRPGGAREASPDAARGGGRSTAPARRCPPSDGVPGGLLLAAYAIFGFVAGYLWARRYLMGELAGGRKEMLTRIGPEVREADDRKMDQAKVAGLVQTVPPGATGSAELALAAARASDRESDALDLELVQAGTARDDPWRGKFGGKSRDNRAELVATVSELATKQGLYQVELRVRGIDAATRSALANQPVRVYLHPTFPNYIRTLNFDITGELRLPLVAYGAFTVGAQFKDDARLELDLAALPGVPEQFRSS